MQHPSDTGAYGIEHHSSPYGDSGILTISAPPPPQVSPPPSEPKASGWRSWLSRRKEKPGQRDAMNIDIEASIARTVTEQIDESRSFGTSLLQGIKRYLVPLGTIMDIVSAFLRFLTLGFLIILPEIYNAIFTPPKGDMKALVAHFVILTTSIVGIAIGTPVALFSSVYSLVTLLQKADAANRIKKKAIRTARKKLLRQKIIFAWAYIIVAFMCSVAFSVPYILQKNPTISQQTLLIIAEAVFIVVPFICAIVTMITEREAGSDEQEKSSQLGVNLGLSQVFAAGVRLARGQGTHRDAAAIRSAIDGDMMTSIEAGVTEPADVKYLTLAEISVRLGHTAAKDDPFRRTLNNIVSAAHRRGEYAIIQHPKKGWLVPETAFVSLFDKYLDGAPAQKRPGGKVLELVSKDEGDEETPKAKRGRKNVEKSFWKRVRYVFDPKSLGA